MSASTSINQSIALNRFGLGALPDEAAPLDPRRWLLDQCEQGDGAPAGPNAGALSSQLLSGYVQRQRGLRDMKDAAREEARKALQRDLRAQYFDAVTARTVSALQTRTPFVERLVHFWSNHFALSIEKPTVIVQAGAFETEAIRPHVLGRFEDMLIAVEQHPAMLFYLDQERSIGPDSTVAVRSAKVNPERKRGLNENLAREIMELHTLGVRSGYSQADVTEFARALTGWSVGGLDAAARPAARRGAQVPVAGAVPGAVPAAVPAAVPPAIIPGAYAFRPGLHEPGSRSVMGRPYAQQGEGQGTAILRDLASHPSTARFIATKLARHFVADAPPDALVDRLADAFLRTRGDLKAVYRALVESPEAWVEPVAKFKTPWEWMLSSLRGLGRRDLKGTQMGGVMQQLGQPVWRPGSPAGYDDVAASWAAPEALVRRVELAQRLAAQAGDSVDARVLATRLLPGTLGKATADAIERAESGTTALALLLVSPDFLRR